MNAHQRRIKSRAFKRSYRPSGVIVTETDLSSVVVNRGIHSLVVCCDTPPKPPEPFSFDPM